MQDYRKVFTVSWYRKILEGYYRLLRECNFMGKISHVFFAYILYSINIVKFRMLLIFSNDFCYLYYELKMRKHGWNRMLNCAFTKNWHLRLDKFGSCQFSRNATKHIKLKMILQTMSVYPYVSVLTRQRN